MVTGKLLLVLALFCTLYSAFGDDACPFDSACKCSPSSTKTRDFSSVACSSSALPDLTGKAGVTYSVGSVVITSENIAKLPAGYFKSFSDIGLLVLINNASDLVDQQFDADAFKSVQISKLWFRGISKLIPVPESIKVQSGLEVLSINHHGQANVEAAAFQAFMNLTSLSIQDAPITIDDYALSGLEHRLETLVLAGLRLQAFPGAALSNLRWLKSLDLSVNGISSIPNGILTAYPRLSNLDLSGNPLSQDIMSGNLNSLPTTLTTLYLMNVGLKSVPSDLLQENPQLATIALSENQIDHVRINDFVSVPGLNYLLLENNPISMIDRGSFQRLNKANYFVLSNTSLTSIDFSLFAGTAATNNDVSLDSNSWLTSIDFHQVGQMPTTLRIRLTNSGLKTINQGIKALLDHSSAVSIDISGNANVDCTGLDWLAPYVLCSEQIMTDNYTLCSDQKNMRMDAYMQSVFKGQCPSAAPPTSGVPTTTTGGSTSTGGTLPATTTSGSAQISASVITFILALMLAIFKS